VAIYLQNQKKLDVIGIDISPLAIKVCTLRGLRRAQVTAFEDIDFGPESFDTVVMYGNNFGLFGSKGRARKLLRRLFVMTSPDAQLICETRNPYQTANPVHLAYHRRNRARGRMPGQLRLRVRYGVYIGRWFDYLLASPDEMKELARGTGWRVARTFRSGRDPLYVGILRKESRGS